jgi:DNA mismatch repair protein MutS
VLTPGSVVGEAFLDPAVNNFLAALWLDEDGIGLCLADASTAEVKLAEWGWAEAPGALASLRVSEWLVPDLSSWPAPLVPRATTLLRNLAGPRTPLGPEAFLDERRLLERWPAERALLDGLPRARVAAAATLVYLDRVQGAPALGSARLERWQEERTLRMDAATARHLELFHPSPGGETTHTLWHHVNRTVSALGARRLRAWIERPLADPSAIAARHDAVSAWLAAGVTRAAFRERLKGFPDLERLASRLALARATPRDLGAIRDGLARLPALAETLGELATAGAADDTAALDGIPELGDELQRALVEDPPPVSRDGGLIRTGYDEHRDRLDRLAHSGKRWIAELEVAERARTGITSLKVGYNRVFGYYLEVTRPHLDKVPADYERRQTLTTAERFVTPELKQKESEVLGAEDKLEAREHELFVTLRERAARHVPALVRAAETVARLDATATLAETAARHGWVRPVVDDSGRLELEAARHPVVEQLLPRGEFVPNDVRLDRGERQILLLTGPNMGGKSTFLRQIALSVVLGQCGSFVPAASATIGVVDRLFTRVGASDRLGAGESTFMVEMRETADILRDAGPRALVLLDELGRGTATYDGLALAWAVTEQLHAADGARPRTVFATHYHELTGLAGTLTRLANIHVTVKEWGEGVVFLHRIAEGAADRSYGIHVAQLAGLPPRVLARAREVLHELESERTAEHLRGAPPVAAPVAPAPGEIVDTLRRIDPDTMTPLEALRMLADWRQRFGR